MSGTLIGKRLKLPRLPAHEEHLRPFRLTKRRSELLLHLARRGSMNPFRLSRQLAYPLSTTQKILSELEENGLVRVLGEEPWRKGMKKRTYGLTTNGVCLLFSVPRGMRWRRDILTGSRHAFPAGLVDWLLALRGKDDELAERVLKETCASVLRWGPISLPWVQFMLLADALHRFDWIFLLAADAPMEMAEREHWFRLLAGSEVLRQRLAGYLSGVDAVIKTYPEQVKRLRSLISHQQETKAHSAGRR